MIQVKKTRKTKSIIAIIASSAALVLLIAGIIVMAIVMNDEEQAPVSQGSSITFPIGEPIKDIARFEIESHNGYFGGRNIDGTYYYYYKDANGERQPYNPPICYTEPGYRYTSLYALTDDGMNAQKLSYILYAMANLSYESRIELLDIEGATREEQLDNYENQLKAYGLNKEERETVAVTYYVDDTDENGKAIKVPKTRTVHIGNKLVTGTGYYIKLDGNDLPEGSEYDADRADRDRVVYVSSGAENFRYALEGFESFVKPWIVMGANSYIGDTGEIPQLTTSYRQWTNVVYDNSSDKVKANTKVIFTADVFSSDGNDSEIKLGADGYISSINKTDTADLGYLASNEMYKAFVNMLIGKYVGDYSSDKLISTIVFDQNPAEIGKTYSYKIYEIEAFIDGDGTEYRSGTVGQRNIVKVRYSCTVDGKEEVYEGAEANMLHAIIDLSDSRIPSEVVNKIRGLEVGEIGSAIEFDITYTETNSTPSTYQYKIKHISNIIDNKTMQEVYVIGENTSVVFAYTVTYNGDIVEEGTTTINLSLADDDESVNELYKSVKAALLNAKMNDKLQYPTDIIAYTSNSYFQAFKDFTTYEIKSIDYFVESKEIASFKYVNVDEVDNFLGGVIHINTLKDSVYSSYDLDMESCDRVIRILSGTLPGAATTTYQGLAGEKVVAVGLTPENMKKYHLYAYTIYYELPRFVDLDENTWKATVGFTIHISENIDGKRYIGSDMYDIIVEIDAATFDFVEKSFVDFWASRDLPMIDQSNVENLTVEFNLEGFKGRYSFSASHPEAVWLVTYKNGQPVRIYDEPSADDPNIISAIKYEDAILISVSVSGDDITETELVKQLNKNGVFNEITGQKQIDISAAYYLKDENPRTDTIGYDFLGEAYFKDVLYAIYSTDYLGTLSEEEAALATARKPAMSFSFGVTGSNRNNIYRFYYTDTGKVAVEIDDGVRRSCHFYITNQAFKGLVNVFYDLVNGNTVEINAGYKN